MKLSLILENVEYTVEQKDDGWIIRTKYGYIDYVHDEEMDTNEI